MRVALLPPHPGHSHTALGADYSSRRLFDALQERARDVEFDVPSTPSTFSGPSPANGLAGLSPSRGSHAIDPSKWDLMHDVRPAGDPRRHFRLRAARGLRFPIVFTHHSICYPTYLDGFFAPLLLCGCQTYDAVVCTSEPARTAFGKLLDICADGLAEMNRGQRLRFDGRLPVIPNGVDTDLFRPRDRADVRHQLGLPTGVVVILWVGRLSGETKADLHPLLMALRLLRDRNPEHKWLLVLVGTDADSYGTCLEASAAAVGLASEIRIERVRPESPVHLWYSAADVFVSPVDNVQETFGNAPIEAMAAGVPQVVSDWDGYRDTVVHGVTGFRARTLWGPCDDTAVDQWAFWGDVQGCQALLAQAVACDIRDLVLHLETLLRSPELRAEMSRASRARALAEYAWPVIVDRYTECWTELIQSSNCSPKPIPQPTGILPDFFRAFGGYASHVLTGTSRLRPYSNGPMTAVADFAGPAQGISAFDALPEDARQVLKVVSAVCNDGELTVDQLTRALRQEFTTPAGVYRAVLKAAKYGLLDVS